MSEKIFEIKEENRFTLDPTFLMEYVGKQPKWDTLGYVVYLRTYSRVLTDKQKAFAKENFGLDLTGNEEFWQTAQRVVEGMFSILKQRAKTDHRPWDDVEGQIKAQEFFKRMWAFKLLPPGRGLFAMGTDIVEKKGGLALFNCAARSTKEIDVDFSQPFCDVMDFLMHGCGCGYDLRGANKVTLTAPVIGNSVFVVEDSREGWIAAVKSVLDAFVGKGELPYKFDVSKVRPEGAPLVTFGGIASGPGPLVQLLDGLLDLLSNNLGRIKGSVISDMMNLIGRCVVVGGIRRSSEIAIGEPGDTDFVSLKDPTDAIALRTKMLEILSAIPEWVSAETEVLHVQQVEQANYSVLSKEYASAQDKIDALRKAQGALAYANQSWLALKAKHDALPLNAFRWASNNSVFCTQYTDYDKLAEQTVRNGEPGYMWLDICRTYGRLADVPNPDPSVDLCNPCAEIPLEGKGGTCNLVETFPNAHDTLEDFLVTLKYAYLYAKTVTLVPTHNPRFNEIIASKRRLGISLAGVFEMYERKGMRECTRWFDEGYKYLKELDREYSNWLGINKSIRLTTTKPGGSVPLLCGVEGGLKVPTAPFYFRTIRIDHLSPLAQSLKEAGYRVEPDRVSPRTVVAYFPCKTPDGIRTGKDVSLWEQAALLACVQRWWADNAVSITLNFRPGEEQDVARVLKAYAGQLKTASFLPLSDHAFMQAPYIPISEADYEFAVSKIRPLNGHTGDTHEVAAEDKYCSSGVCEISQGNVIS
jgi:adenosylcobalamin-dependent ribonucleoside-triphosphate reductase